MTTRELYGRQSCPYSEKVRKTLEELDLAYEETNVPEKHADRTEVENRTGQTGVPILFDPNLEDDWLDDSMAIVDFLEETYG